MQNRIGDKAQPSNETIMILYRMVTEIFNFCQFLHGHGVCYLVPWRGRSEHYDLRDHGQIKGWLHDLGNHLH